MNVVERANPADEIVPGLLLGSRYAALNETYLKEKKVASIFNCTKDIIFLPCVKRQFRVPVDDNLEDAEIRNLELWSYEIAYKIAHELRIAKEKDATVLVHCAAGMQRSAASVAMYLIAFHGKTTDEAIEYIQSKRSIAFRPSANFEKSIRGFEATFYRDVKPRLAV
jgi:rhodanese-related sulfurtransferase